MNQYDREEQDIEERYANGDITYKEFLAEMRDLRLSYQAAAEEAAQEAYDNEMGRW